MNMSHLDKLLSFRCVSHNFGQKKSRLRRDGPKNITKPPVDNVTTYWFVLN